jgi:hypothetical protein
MTVSINGSSAASGSSETSSGYGGVWSATPSLPAVAKKAPAGARFAIAKTR